MGDERDENPARRAAEHITEFLRRQRDVQKLVPEVQKIYGTAVWYADTRDAICRESPEMARELDAEAKRRLSDLQATLPLPHAYSPVEIRTLSTANVSATSQAVVAAVSLLGNNPSLQPALYVQVNRYQALVAEQEREAEASSRVVDLFPTLSQQFEQAMAEVHVARGDPSREQAAATALRTFLDKLQGELFALARQRCSLDMNWDRMATTLGSGRNVELVQQAGESRQGLIGRLSDVLKARHSNFDFGTISAQAVDHVYVVCGAVLASEQQRKSTGQ